MKLLLVTLYFFAVTAIGMSLLRDRFQVSVERFLIAPVLGSLVTGLLFYVGAVLGWINGYSMGVVCALSAATIFYARQQITADLAVMHRFLADKLCGTDKYRMLFIVSAILLIIWIVGLSHAPARSADAMRYHLAQLEDIVRHGALVFRPYLHYQFPLYFSMSWLPVYYYAGAEALQLVVCLYFLLSLVAATCIAERLGVVSKRLLFLLLFLVPMSYHEAHNVFNDWVVNYCYLVAALLLVGPRNASQDIAFRHCEERQATKQSMSDRLLEPLSPFRLLLAFTCVGYALGVKYQAVLMIPWMVIIAYSQLQPLNPKLRLGWLLAALTTMTVVASPFYLRNAIVLGNPLFPLMVKHFPGHYPYFDQLAIDFSQGMTGKISLSTMQENLTNFLKFTHIPAVIWLFSGIGVWFARNSRLQPLLGLLAFWGCWLIITPLLYMRFAFFAMPLALIAGVAGWEQLLPRLSNWVRMIYQTALIGMLGVFALVAGYYSLDYGRYFLHQDVARFHRDTWFYPTFQWIDKNTEQDAKFLAILAAGQTFYLPREYQRADLGLSAEINWSTIHSSNDLARVLQQGKFNYVVINHAGNTAEYKPYQLLETLSQQQLLQPAYQATERLTSSRVHHIYDEVQVTIYQVNQQRIAAELKHAYT